MPSVHLGMPEQRKLSSIQQKIKVRVLGPYNIDFAGGNDSVMYSRKCKSANELQNFSG